MEVLQNTLGKPCLRKDLGSMLNHSGSLGRSLEDHSVSGQDGRDKRVYENKVRVLGGISCRQNGRGIRTITYVPSEDDQDWANRDLSNKSLEALLRLSVGILESFLADLEEILTPLHSCGDLPRRVVDRPSHLSSKLLSKLVLLLKEAIEELADDCLSLLQSGLPEALERLGGDSGKRLKVGRRGAVPGEDGLVGVGGDGGDDFNGHDDDGVCSGLAM